MIAVNNFLRIFEPGILQIPGREPISTVTSVGTSPIWAEAPQIVTIDKELRGKIAYITVKKALQVIPGSYITNSSDTFNRLFFLPSGPPPGDECPCHRIPDWYQILRNNADYGGPPEKKADEKPKSCSGFDFSWCRYKSSF